MTTSRRSWLLACAGGGRPQRRVSGLFAPSRSVTVTTASVTLGPIARPIVATGTLQPVTTVQVGSQISGLVQSLDVDFNSLVHKGEVLARLDPSTYQAQLTEAQANLLQAKADETRLQAALEDAQTKLGRAEALAKEATDHAVRPRRRPYRRRSSASPTFTARNRSIVQAHCHGRSGVARSRAHHHPLADRRRRRRARRRRRSDGRGVDSIAAAVQDRHRPDEDAGAGRRSTNRTSSAVSTRQSAATFDVGSYPGESFHGIVSQVRLQPISSSLEGLHGAPTSTARRQRRARQAQHTTR